MSRSMSPETAERVLDLIHAEVDRELNPGGDECLDCGGEGVVHDCFDGLCMNAEWGCGDCRRNCAECARHERKARHRVLVAVLHYNDLELTTAWLKSTAGSDTGMTPGEILLAHHGSRAACVELPMDERGDSACWVEGLV